MEVILKEDVPKLGHRGEVVKVAEGYGRNYLLPHKLAIEATTANRAVIDQMKQSAVRKIRPLKKLAADALAQQLDGTALSFTRKVGEKDHLFGSVTTSDIAEAMERKGFNIDRRKLRAGAGTNQEPGRIWRAASACIATWGEQDQSHGGKRSRSDEGFYRAIAGSSHGIATIEKSTADHSPRTRRIYAD